LKTTSFSLIGFIFVLMAAFYAEAQDLGQVQVLDVTYGGTGCPGGTVDTTFAPQNNQFSVLYSAFDVSVGGDAPAGNDQKSCDVHIQLRLPPGATLNVEAADFRGFVALDEGVSAQHSVDHKVGSTKVSNFGFGTQTFQGPYQDAYFIQNIRPNVKDNKPKCHPHKNEIAVKIRTRIKMKGGDQNHQGLMTVDSADGKLEQKYHFTLRKCDR